MNNLILLVIAVSLIGCGGNKALSGGAGNVIVGPNGKTTRLTSEESCLSGNQASALDSAKIWNLPFKTGNLSYNMAFSFNKQNGLLNLNETCQTASGKMISAYINVAYSSDDMNIQIPVGDSATTTDKTNGENVKCTAALQKGTIQYYFYGSCLVFRNGADGDMYLTPSNY